MPGTKPGNHPPAGVTEALVVAASTITDNQAAFSNFGACVDLYAPGENVTFASFDYNPVDGSASPSNRTHSGTSFASPFVTGIAALYLLTNPAATPAQVEAFILNRATDDEILDPSPGSANELLFSPYGNLAD